MQERVTHNAVDVIDFAWGPDPNTLYFRAGWNREVIAEEDRSEGDRGYLLDERFRPAERTKPTQAQCGGEYWDISPERKRKCTPALWVIKAGEPEREATAAERAAFENPARAQTVRLKNEDPAKYTGSALPLRLLVDGARGRILQEGRSREEHPRYLRVAPGERPDIRPDMRRRC